MKKTDRLKVEKSLKSGLERKGFCLQIFICHSTLLMVLQCLESPGMFAGVVGCDFRVENSPK